MDDVAAFGVAVPRGEEAVALDQPVLETVRWCDACGRIDPRGCGESGGGGAAIGSYGVVAVARGGGRAGDARVEVVQVQRAATPDGGFVRGVEREEPDAGFIGVADVRADVDLGEGGQRGERWSEARTRTDDAKGDDADPSLAGVGPTRDPLGSRGAARRRRRASAAAARRANPWPAPTGRSRRRRCRWWNLADFGLAEPAVAVARDPCVDAVADVAWDEDCGE